MPLFSRMARRTLGRAMSSALAVFASVAVSSAAIRLSPNLARIDVDPHDSTAIGRRALPAATLGLQTAGDRGSAKRVAIAVVDFDYKDTAGEARDQTGEHRARMAAFMSKLRADLAADARFAPVPIACADPRCTAGNTPPAALIAAAKQAGARLLLYGGVHKMSTLIQWGRIQVVDLAADRLVADEMLTFRGDTDEAWLRAEAFLIEELRGLAIAD